MAFSIYDTPSVSAYFIAYRIDNFNAINFHFAHFVRLFMYIRGDLCIHIVSHVVNLKSS